jgi:hypothetical protein
MFRQRIWKLIEPRYLARLAGLVDKFSDWLPGDPGGCADARLAGAAR